MALVQEYFDLCKKYQIDYGENTIVIMQVGSFMECYGILDKATNTITESNIQVMSQICDLTIVEKNCGPKQTVMAGFKDMMIEKYIKKIQEAGFTVVVYMQEGQGKITRYLAGIFSPGTYFSNDSSHLTNNITCIWIELVHNQILLKGKHVVIGISNIDIYTGKTSIFQYKETFLNSPTTYDELERFISIYQPSEVILLSNLSDSEINNAIHYANISCKMIHKIALNSGEKADVTESVFVERALKCEKQIFQKEVLQKFYSPENDSFYEIFYENYMACQSFCFLLDFVYQHNPYLVNKISEPIFENCSDRLILANHSLKQLNMIDSDGYTGKYSSVTKLLNLCITPMGKRKLNHHILNPTTKVDFLQKEYDITEYLLLDYPHYEKNWKPVLCEIKDISKWERQIFLKKMTPKSVCQLYKNMEHVIVLYEGIVNNHILKEYLSPNLIKEYAEKIRQFISMNLDLEIASDIDQVSLFETNFIKKGVDSKLDAKTEMIQDSEDRLEAIRLYLSLLIENKESKNGKRKEKSDYVKIHETEKNIFSLVCTNRRCALLKEALPTGEVSLFYSFQNKKEYLFKTNKTQFEFHKQSASNQSITNNQIQDICKSISMTKIELKDIITSVFQQFIFTFGEQFQKQLESIIQFITLLDVLFAKATIAHKYNYCKPQIVEADKSFICAKQIRHCLIEYLQTNENYVTNDITLGNGKTDGILLYGTNAVGKTCLIRAIGIAVIMAQAGLYVPCKEFTFKPYEYIFTRILGNDNIFKGLSTFAVEMSELRTILRLTNKNSLILGDELCSGTEISSAISIFVAGIKKLYQAQSSFIFATHLHEIVNYEEITSLKSVALNHMSVLYDKERDILVYDRKLRDGPGNNMYGLEVCRSLSLPADFLEDAYEIRMKYQPETASILSLHTSHFNSKKIMGMCEICKKKMGAEVHHLQPQKEANDKGIIETEDLTFHKNHLANLLTLCEDCHSKMHKDSHNLKKTKTTKGYLLEI
jgi:DNA mismatch repair protein MutS